MEENTFLRETVSIIGNYAGLIKNICKTWATINLKQYNLKVHLLHAAKAIAKSLWTNDLTFLFPNPSDLII